MYIINKPPDHSSHSRPALHRYVLQARSHAKHVHLEQDVRLTYFGNVHMSSQEISEGVMCE